MAVWNECLAKRVPYDFTFRLYRADGEWRHIIMRGIPIREADDQVVEWVGVCIDDTERRKAGDTVRLQDRIIEASMRAVDSNRSRVIPRESPWAGTADSCRGRNPTPIRKPRCERPLSVARIVRSRSSIIARTDQNFGMLCSFRRSEMSEEVSIISSACLRM